MKVDFFNSKDFLGSKTKESKIRKLSISKSKIMTISVDNLNWMGGNGCGCYRLRRREDI